MHPGPAPPEARGVHKKGCFSARVGLAFAPRVRLTYVSKVPDDFSNYTRMIPGPARDSGHPAARHTLQPTLIETRPARSVNPTPRRIVLKPGPSGGSRLTALTNLSITAIITGMMTVLLSPDAQQQVEALPKVIRARLGRVVRHLEHWPEVSGVKPLRGDKSGLFRKRTGHYRIIFRLAGENVVIQSVLHRRDAYKS